MVAAAMTDDWMGSAMRDGEVVAEILLRLKQGKVTPTVFANPAVAALRWGIRQPRSQSRSPRCDGFSQRKDADSAKNSRCSPTTPLSWSGGCGSSSPSAYADGCEATSRHTSGFMAIGSRSKIVITEVEDSGSGSGTKRMRKKKTFAELQEEEDSLLKERICLKKEIASLRATFDEQGAENESLKRMKFDLKGIHLSEPSFACRINSQHHPGLGPAVYDSMAMLHHHCKTDSNFLLPDLNMTPPEDKNNDDSPPCMGQG